MQLLKNGLRFNKFLKIIVSHFLGFKKWDTMILLVSLFPLQSFSQFTVISIDTNEGIADIRCLNEVCIVSDSKEKIFITNDEANTFDMKKVPVGMSGRKVEFRFPSENTFFFLVDIGSFVTPAYVLKSIDFGETYDTIYEDIGFYKTFEVVNDSTYIVAGSQSKIYRTSNYGVDWELLFNGGSAIFTEIEFFHDTLGILGRSFAISRTSDLGETLDNGISIGNDWVFDVHFVNASKIFFVGRGPQGGGKIYRSEDGGYNFEVVQNGGYDPFGIDFVSSLEGYVVGRNNTTEKGILLKTLDGGETWTVIPTDYEEELYSIKFMNDSLALIGGEDGLLLLFNKNQLTTSNDYVTFNKEQIIYPNPVNEKLTIRINNFSFDNNVHVYITNLIGQTIHQEYLTPFHGKVEEQIDVSRYPPSTYFLTLKSGEKIITKKFIISR